MGGHREEAIAGVAPAPRRSASLRGWSVEDRSVWAISISRFSSSSSSTRVSTGHSKSNKQAKPGAPVPPIRRMA
jgi:hypothetical protein